MTPATKFDIAFDRVLLVSELLQRSSSPVCAGSLAMTLSDRTNRDWSKRTVLRDLRLLQARGYAKPIEAGRRGATLRWRWSGAGMLRSAS